MNLDSEPRFFLDSIGEILPWNINKFVGQKWRQHQTVRLKKTHYNLTLCGQDALKESFKFCSRVATYHLLVAI